MSMQNLRDLFVHELKDLYSAEKQLLEALPKMAETANSAKLKTALTEHLQETKVQFDRVHSLLQKLGENPTSTKCNAMEGLIEEGADVISEDASPAVKDAALIAAAQRVEHYEMAGYGTARAHAMALGENHAAEVLQKTLEEESQANEALNAIALGEINEKACAVC